MRGVGQHAELTAELTEWWEDLCQCRTGSRIVLIKVPPGWGRTTVLDHFQEGITSPEDTPVTNSIRINAKGLPTEACLQAQVLRDLLEQTSKPHSAAELLGVDTTSGQVQLALGIGSLFAPGLPAAIGFLLAGLATAAAGKAWDNSPAGEDGTLARAARAVAKVSVQVPAAVIIDDADHLNQNLAVTLIRSLTGRHNSQVLVIAATQPGSPLTDAIAEFGRYAPGLVNAADADPGMGYQARLDLARELLPHAPAAAARRIAQRTTTLADIFTITKAPLLAELTHNQDETALTAAVDAVITAQLARPKPSAQATIVAWAGGITHHSQTERALQATGQPAAAASDPYIRRCGALERLADPISPRLAEQTAALATGEQHIMASVLLDEALAITTKPHTSLVDQAAALLAAHRTRHHLADLRRLPRAQHRLTAILEALGDTATALDIATTALGEWPAGADARTDRDALAATVLRLSHAAAEPVPGPLTQQLIADAIETGAITGLEARVWAAATLLDTPGQRQDALNLTTQVLDELNTRTGLGEPGDRWRLLLATATARASIPSITAQLLAPLLASDDPDRHRPARAILDAGDGPRAGTRLQNILLEDQLANLPEEADDDRLRIHHTLADNHATLGSYHHALTHAQHEFHLRTHLQGPNHPDTLITRGNIALWTGYCGDAAAALALYQNLLPDVETVFGPDHPDTLTDRANSAFWTSQLGDTAAALALYQNLLPALEGNLGPDHPTTLTVRGNIAVSTGHCGDAGTAVALLEGLLPDLVRNLGRDHPDTLITRGNIAFWTGQCGNAAAALTLYQNLLPDRERILGPDHPATLTVRGNIAEQTGYCGDAAAALTLYQNLLPDQKRVLGPNHPDTLITRGNIALWTGHCGDAAAALTLNQNLLPDVETVFGPDHPTTLGARSNIAYWTAQCGDAATALHLLQDLLPDLARVLGPNHPDILATRAYIARLTGEGPTAGAT